MKNFLHISFSRQSIFWIASALLLFIFPNSINAQQSDKVEIMFVGFSHLGQLQDGTPESDIFSSKKQAEIIRLTENLQKFAPDMVMVELDPKEQFWADSLYQLYRQNFLDLKKLEYGAGETFQVGFRMGKGLGLEKINCVDYDQSTSQSLLNKGEHIEVFLSELKRLQTTARPLDQLVKQNKLSIYDYIKRINEPDMVDLTHHLLFNVPAYVKNGDFNESKLGDIKIENINKEYIGAEFISLFYNRNLKIYSNILNQQLQQNGKKIIVLMGQAHVGVLQDLFEENPNYKIVSADNFLK